MHSKSYRKYGDMLPSYRGKAYRGALVYRYRTDAGLSIFSTIRLVQQDVVSATYFQVHFELCNRTKIDFPGM